MTFTRVKALGWALYEELTSAQMNALDIDHANAVDGAAGGSYAASFSWSGAHTWQASNWPKVTSRTVVRPQTPVLNDVQPANWGGAAWYTLNYAAVAGEWCHVDCNNMLDLATITQASIIVSPIVSTRTWPVGTLPAVELYRFDPITGTGGTATQLGTTAVDTSASTVAYEQPHLVILAGLSEAVDHTNNYRYVLRIRGEGGANAVAGLKVTACILYFTVTTVTPGG
jgi:hypothetical protein